MKKSSIAIIGVGYVGSTIAHLLSFTHLAAEILLVDCNTQKCFGELQDLLDAAQQTRQTIRQASYKEAAQADIIIICAGKNQKPGEPRHNLYTANSSIIDSVITDLHPLNPNAILIVVTNPVDMLSLHVYKKNILPHTQIFGAGTWLDTQRLQRFLETDYALPSVLATPYVLGEHGDSSYIVWPTTYPYTTLTDEQKNRIAQKVKQEAYTIIEAKGATAYGVARCVYEYCVSIIQNQQRVFPVSAFDSHEELYYGQLITLSAIGISQNIPLPHTQEEMNQKKQSITTLKKLLQL